MSSIQILDCTLRDGGYINNWAFNDEHTIDIVDSLVESGIDIIECGYLSEKTGKDGHSTNVTRIAVIESLLERTKLPQQKNRPPCALMINFGDYTLHNLPERGPDNLITGIRLAFHRRDAWDAIKGAEIIIAKGYDLFMQPMVTSTYPDDELVQFVKACSELPLHAFYIVDSFGSVSSDELKRLYYLICHTLDPAIKIGFHSHNNMQLSFSNAILFVEMARNRPIIIDASIFGMGRGAGNLNSEIITNYLNETYGKKYDIVALLEIIDNYLETLYRKKYWGFSVAHFLSASAKCHPNYSNFLVGKRTLPVVAIQEILSNMDPAKKISFKEEYAEQLYLAYQTKHKTITGIEDLTLDRENVLILASGPSINQESAKIYKFLQSHKSTVFCANHVTTLNVNPDYFFFSNQKRYNEFGAQIQDSKRLILTSNILPISKHNDCFVVDYQELYQLLGSKPYNVALLLLEMLAQQKVRQVCFAGLDGYDIDASLQYSYDDGLVREREMMEQQNRDIGEGLAAFAQRMAVHFITASLFEKCIPKQTSEVIL